MLVMSFFIGLFFLLFSSQVLVKISFKDDVYSIVLIKSLILSLSIVWLVFLISYYSNLSNVIIRIVVFAFVIFSIFKLYQYRDFSQKIVSTFILSFLILYPLWKSFGDIFTSWDALVSWNRWAIDIYHNSYTPEGTAYPVLLSSLLGFIYKMQGSAQIWWTAKIALFIIPCFIIMILVSLYFETKNIFFIFAILFSYTYLTDYNTISGCVDFPVALLGLLALFLLYYLSIGRLKQSYDTILICIFFISSLSVVLKQSGLVYLFFSFLFIVFNYKNIINFKKTGILLLLSLFYPVTFMFIFYTNGQSAIQNLDYLQSLSSSGFSLNEIIRKVHLFLTLPSYDVFFLPVVFCIALVPAINCFFNKKNDIEMKLLFFLLVMFILGFIIWFLNFSYDARNGIWVKSFLIVSGAIGGAWLYENNKFSIEIRNILKRFDRNRYLMQFNYIQKVFIRISLLFAGILLCYIVYLGDGFAFSLQEKQQKNIGNVDISKKINLLISGKEKCVKVITNRLPMYYNYYLKDFKNQIISNAWYVQGFLPYLEHNCKDGRYFVFGEWTKTSINSGWELVERLVKDDIIKTIDPTLLVYYIPPIQKGEK